jgi:3-methyladenine DNA glycosylase AlkD
MADKKSAVNNLSDSDLKQIAAHAEAELRHAGTPERAEHERAYLKSSLEHAGASLPAIRALAKRIRADHSPLDVQTVFRLAHELWSKPLHERRMLAVIVLQLHSRHLEPRNLEDLEVFLRDSRTWALVDGLAGDVAAEITLRHPLDPTIDQTLRRWADDGDFWLQRSAVLAHLGMVGRAGDFAAWDRLCELADALLDEREFFVRKAIGWVLRESGKRRPTAVVEFLSPRIPRVSGVTLREAVRYLDPPDREALMAQYSSRRRR